MLPRIRKWLRRLAYGLAIVLVTIFAVRAWDAWRSPPLKLWHTVVPQELDARQLDASDWAAWLKAENAVFDEVRTRVSEQLPAADRVRTNRYFAGSPMYAEKFATDWNRSYVLMPAGTPRGAVVLLHGLTDSPYSLRHVAARYREQGFVAIGMRLPAHGSVPGALATTRWEDWMAATRLAVRHARELAGAEVPLHVVGYSNGGALAVKYALDALENPELARPDRLVLFSPMIGITSMARFAGVLGWPAAFPSFAKAAWLDVVPEYNPFKYNSFPVNGARQSSQLTRALEAQLAADWKSGALQKLPPILTFQSVFDATVSARAVFDTLYTRLPDNGSEIVLIDRNRNAEVSALMRTDRADLLTTLLPAAPRRYAVTVLSNARGDGPDEEAQTVAAEQTAATTKPLAQRYPAETFSLSHVALPFPPDDGLYGSAPDPAENFGAHIGTFAVRGERGTLIVGTDTLMRASSNPFFDYVLERIDTVIAAK